MKNIIFTLLGSALSVAFFYGGYYIAKNISYVLFYESLVIESISETVKASCLK